MIGKSRTLLCAAVLVGLSTAAQADDLKAETVRWGRELFIANCASCHGADGKGNGPAAAALNKTPPDLTRIAQRNGGKFPRLTVEEIIDGQRFLVAHGNREMPIWGDAFAHEEGTHRASMRVFAIAEYVESMQTGAAKAPPSR